MSRQRVTARQRVTVKPVRTRQSPTVAKAGARSTVMSTTKTHTRTTTTEFPPLSQMGGKAFDAVSAIAEANQRVVGQLIELSSSAAAERLRTFGELQSAALEAARGVFTPM